jgi:DNA (cytosine-5)-methyltransferase 1
MRWPLAGCLTMCYACSGRVPLNFQSVAGVPETSSVCKVVDLFSGCGGMSAGFHRYTDHFQIIGAVDKEVAKPGRGKSEGTSTECNPTYERNIGVAPKNADLAVLDPEEYRTELGLDKGELGVLISCAPCTGFSQKNARNHVEDDPRNRLVERTAEFVSAFVPEFLVMENVKELVQGNQRHHFQNLKNRIEADLGYSVCAEVHDLSEFGLPQRRIRALVIARRDGPVVGLPRKNGRLTTVREAIGHLPPVRPGEPNPTDPMHVAPRNSKQVQDRLRAIPKDGGSWADVMNDPNRSDDEKRYLLIPAMFRARPGSFPDVYGRLWWDRPAITITRECAHVGNGRFVHPDQDRLLTVREMALLQGFPSDYYFEGSLTARYNQIGDAVPPAIAAQVAEHLIRIKSGDLDVDAELSRRRPQLPLFG